MRGCAGCDCCCRCEDHVKARERDSNVSGGDE